MPEDNTQSTLRARFGAMRVAGRTWFWPFCAGLVAGLVVLPLVGLLWLSHGPAPSAGIPAGIWPLPSRHILGKSNRSAQR